MSTGGRPNGESSLQPGQMLDDVRQQASARVSDQKQRAASGMESVAQAVSQLGEQLRQQNPSIASFADTTASQLRQFSTQLEQRDIGELVDEVERLARRNPALFIGGAFALGLLGARFLKSNSSEANSTGYYSSRDYMGTRGGYDSTAGSPYRASGTQTGRNRLINTDTPRPTFDSGATSLEG